MEGPGRQCRACAQLQGEGPAGAEGSRLVAASSQRDSPGVQNLLHRFCERVLCSPVWGQCLPVNDLLCVPAPSCSPQPWEAGRVSPYALIF